ncbi:AAA family ATPase, partial [Deinococcus sp. 14RED07]
MKTLFVAPTRNGVGLSSTALGLTRALERQGLKVAFLKPIAQTHEARTDDSVHFARTLAHLPTPEPITLTRAEEQLSLGAEEDLMEEVVTLARQVTGGGADVLIVEGLALNERNVYAGALNASLARNLEADTVLVSSLAGVGAAELADELEISAQAYRRSDGSGLSGYVLNFAPPGLDFGTLMAELRA